MKILQQADYVIDVSYSHEFRWKDDPHAGFGIPCDADGNVESEEDAEKLAALFGDSEHLNYNGVEEGVSKYRRPAVGECHCGHQVTLSGFTNQCKCGAYYNSSGQRLKDDPRTWGEETGEHWCDILRIP